MKLSGEFLATLSAIFIGLSVPVAVLASREIGVFQVTTYSSLISVIFLIAISIVAKEKIQFKKSLTKHLKDSMSIVIARPVIGSLLLVYGFSLTTAIRSSFLMRLEPVFVTIISYVFLKDKINFKQISLILLMVFGAFLLSTSGNIESISQMQIGDLFVILSLLFFSYAYVPAKRIGKEIGPMTITIVNNLIGGFILFLIMLFLPINPFPINSTNAWLILSYVLSFSVVGLYLYFAALRKAKPCIVSSLLSLSAVVGATIGYMWLGESIDAIQIIGAFIILASSYLISKK
jgi:drug/metabolite transporter (DMT)-like permease